MPSEEADDCWVRRRIHTEARRVHRDNGDVVVMRAIARRRAGPGVAERPAVVFAADGPWRPQGRSGAGAPQNCGGIGLPAFRSVLVTVIRGKPFGRVAGASIVSPIRVGKLVTHG